MRDLMSPNSRLRLFDRVRNMSPESANRKIDIRTQHSIERASAGGRAAMEQRLTELQQELESVDSLDETTREQLAEAAAEIAATLRRGKRTERTIQAESSPRSSLRSSSPRSATAGGSGDR